jgi:16S rRNA (uracil1498-N3)-methyltransferase
LFDGAGRVAVGAIASLDKRSVEVAVERVDVVSAPPPIHVRVPVADRDRMLWLAEKATELGITTWQAVRFRRSASVSPRGEGSGFADKVRARMIAALEQSGGAWLPRILPDTTPDAIAIDDGLSPIVLDIHGAPLATLAGSLHDGEPMILFGPEGGLDGDELDALLATGWQRARVAATTLRFETAGLAAIAVCRNTQLLEET